MVLSVIILPRRIPRISIINDDMALNLVLPKYPLPERMHVGRLGKRGWFFCYRLLLITLFLFEGITSSSGCLRTVVLLYCGTPYLWPFHITILNIITIRILLQYISK